MTRKISVSVLLGLVLLLAAACSNPAADAPAADVSSPASEPAASTPPASTEAVVYSFSEDSSISFVGSKVTGSHDGGFQSFTGQVSVVGGSAEGSSVDVAIDTTSIWSDDEKLTGHLKSADFFDVENYPTASFKSTSIAATGDGSHTITGNLDLHGVTKQISFPATIEVTDTGFSATAEFSIKRFDFGIEYKGPADNLIRDDVLIKLALRSAGTESDAGGESEGSAG